MLVLLPSLVNNVLTYWQGPLKVIRRVGLVEYEILHLGAKKEKQIYHINLLKVWHEPEVLLISSDPELEEFE